MQEDSDDSGQLLDAARRTASAAPPGPQRLARGLRRHGPGCHHAAPGTRPTNMSSPKHDRNRFDRAGKPAGVTPTPLVRYLASVETADAAEEDFAGVRRLTRDGVIGPAVAGIIVRQAAGWVWSTAARPLTPAPPAPGRTAPPVDDLLDVLVASTPPGHGSDAAAAQAAPLWLENEAEEEFREQLTPASAAVVVLAEERVAPALRVALARAHRVAQRRLTKQELLRAAQHLPAARKDML
jgi:hypothetical protein